MRKVFHLLVVLITLAATASAQKQQLSDLITEKHKWVYAYAFEKGVTLNASDKIWQMLQDESKSPKGHNSFRILGAALIDLSDRFNDTVLESKCGSGTSSRVEEANKPDCKAAIDAWSAKLSVVINAQGVPANNEGYRLLNGYVTTLAYLFDKGSRSLWRSGYAPKAEKQHYVINMDNKYKDVQASWSKDGTTFTVNLPAEREVSEWDRKIENGFKTGWVKK